MQRANHYSVFRPMVRFTQPHDPVRRVFLTSFGVLLLLGLAWAGNPVPQIVSPVSPQAVLPGSPSFTLTVRGVNFVPGAVVNWNGSPRTTMFISSMQLQAQILASDVAVATAGFITVTNPGGPTSSSSYGTVEVRQATQSVSVSRPVLYQYQINSPVPSAVAADFTGDSILDLLSVDGVGTANLAIGRGHGSFKMGPDFTESQSGAVAFGDFNNDGKLDFAALASKFDIELGRGDGTFYSAGTFGHRYYIGGFENQLVVADFNQDGNLDLAAFDQALPGIVVLLGNGDGTFQSQQTFVETLSPSQMAAADFNNDGHLDMVTEEGSNTGYVISLWLGSGDGTFRSPVILSTVTGYDSVFSFNIFAIDLNGDGNFDLLVGVAGGLDVFLGKGDGSFSAPVFYASSFSTMDLFSIAYGDFNSDGNTDVLLSSLNVNAPTKCGVLLGNADGTLQPIVPVNTREATYGIGIVTADFNSDGKLDFVFLLGGSGMNIFIQK